MCICPLKTHSLLYSLRMNPKKHESVIQTKYNQFRKRIAIRKHNRRRVGIELFTKTLKFIIRDFDLVTFTIWHFGQFYRTAAPTSSHSARGEQPGSDLVQNRKWWSLWPNLILETFHCVFHFDWTNRTTWCFKIDSFMSLTMIPSLHSSLFHFCQTRCLTYSLTKSTNESKWHTMRKDKVRWQSRYYVYRYLWNHSSSNSFSCFHYLALHLIKFTSRYKCIASCKHSKMSKESNAIAQRNFNAPASNTFKVFRSSQLSVSPPHNVFAFALV